MDTLRDSFERASSRISFKYFWHLETTEEKYPSSLRKIMLNS